MIPEVFGDYLLTGRLAERSMAEVYLAVKLGDRSGRTFVVKRAPLGERVSGSIAESLRREADVLRAGRIDGLASLEDEGEVGGLPFVVIEHVRGVPLASIIQSGPLERDEAALIARDLAKAIGALHERGWVHGDVAPSNVIVDEAGELTLIDLGLARRAGEARETPAGKAGYASPDAALGKDAAQADDVYGWAVVVCECLLGTRLFPESDLAEAAARSAVLPAAARELPKLKEALNLDAALRPSAPEIVAALEAPIGARAAVAARAAEIKTPPSIPRSSRRASNTVPGLPVAAVATLTAPSPVPAAVPAAGALTSKRSLWLLAALAVSLMFAVGYWAGRRSERRTTKTTLTLPMLPTRTEVVLDGRTMLVSEPGRPIPIEPGKHQLSVSALGKGEHEFEFVAQPGDHIVIVTVRLPTKRK